MSGAGSADIEAEGSLVEETGTANASLAFSDFKMGEPVLAALLGSAPGGSASLRVAADQRIEVSELAIHGRALTASGHGALDTAAASVDAALQIRLTDLAPVLAAADTEGRGEASFDVRLQGSPSEPRVSVDGRMHGAVADVGVRSARLQLTAEDVLAAPAGGLSLDGDTGLGSARFSTAFGLEGWQILRLSRI
jgi:autotransporter translocation and assembly factor TamB